ncbi:MAG TPA: hypothetical protein VIC55_00995 [Gemmatimonadaceae bacterium]
MKPPVVAPPAAVQRAIEAASTDSVTQTRFRNVNFHVAPGVVLEIAFLRGQMVSKTKGGPVLFDDKQSFVIHIDTALVALDTTSLDHLMNEHVFAYHGAPLRRLSFGTTGDQLIQRGVLHKVIDIPFQITATVGIMPNGEIRLHPTSVRIGSLNGGGLMHALGITLSSLLDLRGAKGIRVEKNDLLLDPEQVLPPPAIAGRVTAVRVESGRLVQTFGSADGGRTASRKRVADLTPPDTAAPNYMYFHNGTLRFGKLFMVRADMQIIDLRPATSFDFSIDRYNEQLVAGYSKNQPNMSLEVFMPDLSSVDSGRKVAAHP